MPGNHVDIAIRTPHAALLQTVGSLAAERGIEAYAVGGLVRDMLRPIAWPPHAERDLDFLTVGQGSGIRLARIVARALGGRTVHVYEKFGTAAVRVPSEGGTAVLEFVAARRESYRRNSRKPLVETGTLEDDLLRRDFTVNAIAMHLAPGRLGELIDPHGGQRDIEHRVLRTPRPPGQTFADDPLRMVRAARFVAQLGFNLDAAVLAAMQEEAHRIRIVSQERITEELETMMGADAPYAGWHCLDQTALLPRVFPELAALKGVDTVRGRAHKDNFYHTLQVLGNVVDATHALGEERDYWLRWAALLHDIAKPRVKRFVRGTGWTFHGHEDVGSRMVPKLFRRFRLPLDFRMEFVRKLVALHHRPVALVDDTVSDSAVRRLLFDAGEDLDYLMMLVRADITSRNPHRVRRYLRAFDEVEDKFAEVEAKDHLRNFQPPVDGNEIMEVIGISQGIAVGIIKDTIREAILEGEIPNEHDAAFALMMQIKDEALRRGELFDEFARGLPRSERRAMGAIKDELFRGDVPADPAQARMHLAALKDRVLSEEAEDGPACLAT